jgi:shikimate dehydrogenase
MQKYAVIGYPLTHSLSPQIHNYAFNKLNIDAVYNKIEIHPDDLDKSIQQLKSTGINGLNITIPHKLNIMSFLDQIDADAKAIGAVNTIAREGNKWIGYNTDVKGFLAPLIRFKERIDHCLILGTGGAARAVVFALAKYILPQSITIAGRNSEKAASLNNEFSPRFKKTDLLNRSFDGITSNLSKFNLVVNTTPLGTYPKIDETPFPDLDDLSENTIVYDLVYNPLKTKFLKDAESAGKNIHLINGMEMLIQQAASAFKLWTGLNMPINEVRDYISNQ